MINRVVLVGRIATDPDMRYTGEGIPVVNFRIAVDRRFGRQEGEREADFFTVVAWRKTAEFVSTYLEKGRLIAVDGRLQSRSYQAREGGTRNVVEVVADSVQVLDRRGEVTAEVRESYQEAPAAAAASRGRSEEFGIPPLQEELPDEELGLEVNAGASPVASTPEQEEDEFDPFADPFGD